MSAKIEVAVWFRYSDGSESVAMSGIGGPHLVERARKAFAACQADETHPVEAWVQSKGSGTGGHRWTLEQFEGGV